MLSLRSLAGVLCALAAACAGGSGGPDSGSGGSGGSHVDERTFTTYIVDAPCPRAGASFGFCTAVLDYDGDTLRDIAVGAPGEGAVYVFFGGGDVPFSEWIALQSEGEVACPVPLRPDGFGTSVAAGDLDGDGDDELLVGAPYTDVVNAEVGVVYVFGVAGEPGPLAISHQLQDSGWLGYAIATGDFDGDQVLDFAASAIHAESGGREAGRVHVFLEPLGRIEEVVLEDPAPIDNANFGLHLAADDADGDGLDDLFISAIGNTSLDGVELAGQVLLFPGPPRQGVHTIVEDRFPLPFDEPRYGMHIAARGGLLAVGAPRKDFEARVDTGLVQTYLAPGFVNGHVFVQPNALPHDLMGYRTLVADLIGDERLDVATATLPTPQGEAPNEPTLFVWDAGDPEAEPVRLGEAWHAGSHFTTGISSGQLLFGGWEELVLGDPRYDRPGHGIDDDSGRFVVYW
jgi:hypothetical protein